MKDSIEHKEKKIDEDKYLYTKYIHLNNIDHDTLVDNILWKTEFKNIDVIKEIFDEKIECILVEEYKEWLETTNIKNIVIKAWITKLQKNYQSNIKLILNRKAKFQEYFNLLKEKKENNIDIGINVITIAISKAKTKEDICSVLELFNQNIKEIDSWLLFIISKTNIPFIDIKYIFERFFNKDEIILNNNIIKRLLIRAENTDNVLNFIQKYNFNLSELTIENINWLLSLNTDLSLNIDFLMKNNFLWKINIYTINILLKNDIGLSNIDKILDLLPIWEYFNIDTISILLYKMNNIIEINQFKTFFNKNIIITKKQFINNYFINKISEKFWYTSLNEFYMDIKNILYWEDDVITENNLITEDNWDEYI